MLYNFAKIYEIPPTRKYFLENQKHKFYEVRSFSFVIIIINIMIYRI